VKAFVPLLILALVALAGLAALLTLRNRAKPDVAASANNAAAPLDPTEQAPPQSPPAVPPVAVRIGGQADLDARASTGRVVGLKPEGDNFLSGRSSPDLYALETDRLKAGADVYLCDDTKKDGWVGVVYQAGGTLGDGCGVTSPIAKEQDYAGTCRSGWVSRQYVQLMAG